MKLRNIWTVRGVYKLLRIGQRGIQIASDSSGSLLRILTKSSTEAIQTLAPIEVAEYTTEESAVTKKTIADLGKGFLEISGEIDGTAPPTPDSSNVGKMYLVTTTGGSFTKNEIYRSAVTNGSNYSWKLLFAAGASDRVVIYIPNDYTNIAKGLYEWSGSSYDLISGAGSTIRVFYSNSFAPGTPVYNDTSGWYPAIANSGDTISNGIVSKSSSSEFTLSIGGELELTTAKWDAVKESTLSAGGLNPGDWYYTSETEAGKITNIEPAISNIVLKAITNTQAMVVDYLAVGSGLGNTIDEINATASAGQTTFTLAKDPTNSKFVLAWVNNIFTKDFTLSGKNVIFNNALSNGDKVNITAWVSYPLSSSNLILNSFGTDEGSTVSQRLISRSNKQIGEIWASIIDKPLSVDFPNIRIDQQITLNAINHPDIFAELNNIQIGINNVTDFPIIGSEDDGSGNHRLIYSNTSNNIAFLNALYSDYLYHGSYTNWRTLTTPEGIFDIIDVDPINFKITINQAFTSNIGVANTQSYWFRDSSGNIIWQPVTDSVIRSPGGDAVPGVRLLDRFQGHWHRSVSGWSDANWEPGTPNINPRLYTGTNNSAPDSLTSVLGAASDSVNGTPRTGPTTRDRSLSAYLYMYIGTYIL